MARVIWGPVRSARVIRWGTAAIVSVCELDEEDSGKQVSSCFEALTQRGRWEFSGQLAGMRLRSTMS